MYVFRIIVYYVDYLFQRNFPLYTCTNLIQVWTIIEFTHFHNGTGLNSLPLLRALLGKFLVEILFKSRNMLIFAPRKKGRIYCIYRIFWRITRTAYYPHRHKNINFLKKFIVLPALTDTCNPHQLWDQNNCCRHFVCIRPGHESPVRDHTILTRKMAAKLILAFYKRNTRLLDDYLSTLR